MSINHMALLLVAVGGAAACSAYPTIRDLSTDCTVEDAYQFDPTSVDLSTAYTSGDSTPGGVITAVVNPIPDGALCGTTTALEVQASHYNDWGDLVGFYGFVASGSVYRDESAYEGLSFWVRAPGATGKSFTVSLDDANTFSTTADAGTNCTNYTPDGGSPSGVLTDVNGMPISGVSTAAPPANACGNSYSIVKTATIHWQFYTIPFAKLTQTNMPNRVPNSELPGTGLLTDKLMGLVFRMPKEATMDLWIGKLGFYRQKAPGTGSDAAVDAPHI